MSDAQYSDSYDGEGFGEDKYWFNRTTGEVEHGLQSPAPDRLGPFDTAEEAARAPEVLQERARAWADEDAREDDWGAKDEKA